MGTKSTFPEFASGPHLKDSSLVKICFLGWWFGVFFYMKTNRKSEKVKKKKSEGGNKRIKSNADKKKVGVSAGCGCVSYPAVQLRTNQSY